MYMLDEHKFSDIFAGEFWGDKLHGDKFLYNGKHSNKQRSLLNIQQYFCLYNDVNSAIIFLIKYSSAVS